MINVSEDFKERMQQGKRNFLADVEISLKSGTVLKIDNSKLMQNGLKIEDAVSSSGTFQVGSAIINHVLLTLNNIEEEYTHYDFEGAKVRVNLGLQLEEVNESFGENLIRQSKTLMYSDYSFGAVYLTDENGNILTDELGNPFVI